MEPMNIFHKYAVVAIRGGHVVGKLWKFKRTSGKFAKSIFCFLKSDDNKCWIEVTVKRCTLGDGERMQVPCLLNFEGRKAYIDKLQNILAKL